MIYPSFFDSKNSTNLFGSKKNLIFLQQLYKKQKLPKVLMFTGKKGSGKYTLINHFLFSIFDNKNYDLKNFRLQNNSNFLNQFRNNIFPNIIYLKGSDYKSIKIDDIRELKTKISQSAILNRDRFIVLDDVEVFNLNSLNALLKLIEEPNERNFFFLINNKTKPIIETMRSRSIEINILLNESDRLEIIKELLSTFNITPYIDPIESLLTPGDYIKFNHIFTEYNIQIDNNLVDNISLLLDLYKKNKDIIFINVIYFVIDFYFKNLRYDKASQNDKNYEIKNFIFNNLNKFLLYNINQKSLINSLNNKLCNE